MRSPSETTELIPLDPYAVTAWRDERKRLIFTYDGRTTPPASTRRIVQTRYLTMPGQPCAGSARSPRRRPPCAAPAICASTARKWWETGHPSGILSTDDKLTADEAALYRRALEPARRRRRPDRAADNPSRVRVLGKGLHYDPLMISPKDALWIEAQQFDTLEIARIFGVPSSLMMTAIDGNSMTYSNVEQEWLGFVRFGLMAYLRKIEDALTQLTPRGQTVRFNLDALLRSDTTTRYQAHESALRAKPGSSPATRCERSRTCPPSRRRSSARGQAADPQHRPRTAGDPAMTDHAHPRHHHHATGRWTCRSAPRTTPADSFTGVGVPYGETIDLFGMRERFEPGSVELDGDGVPSLVLWRHDEPIGRITAGRDTDAGFEIDGQLSDTPRGREAATLLRDGVITRLSIGFRPDRVPDRGPRTRHRDDRAHQGARARVLAGPVPRLQLGDRDQGPPPPRHP